MSSLKETVENFQNLPTNELIKIKDEAVIARLKINTALQKWGDEDKDWFTSATFAYAAKGHVITAINNELSKRKRIKKGEKEFYKDFYKTCLETLDEATVQVLSERARNRVLERNKQEVS